MAAFNIILLSALCLAFVGAQTDTTTFIGSTEQATQTSFTEVTIQSTPPDVLTSTSGSITDAPTDFPASSPGPNSDNLDRDCACTISKIWLDIVAVIDISQSMTQEGLSEIQANLATVVHQLTLSTTIGYSSRVSIVTFASNATTVAGLDVFSSTDDFENTLFTITLNSSDSKVNILSGLQTANSILGATSTNPNRRRVVILYTSAYDNGGFNSPLPLAENMREDNVKLITVAFAQRMGSSDVDKVGELAWPSFAFTNNQTDLIPKMYDALCQANCFCYSNWRQYSANYTDKYAHNYGVCLFHSSITAGWTPVSHTCRNEAPGAFLTTESTQAKHDFNVAYSADASVNGQYSYHIGLSNIGGSYVWQQPTLGVTVPLGGYTVWNPGYPSPSVGDCVKVDKIFGSQYKWTNEACWDALNYICEANSCDTDNYCP